MTKNICGGQTFAELFRKWKEVLSVIVNNDSFNFSLSDTTNLRKLILENPNLPLLIFAGEDAWKGDYIYNSTEAGDGEIQYLTLYEDIWIDAEEYRDRLADDLCEKEEYVSLSDEEYFEMIDKKVAETEFCKAIVIYVG